MHSVIDIDLDGLFLRRGRHGHRLCDGLFGRSGICICLLGFCPGFLCRLDAGVCGKPGGTVSLHTGTRRNQLTDDDVLLQTDQRIDPAVDRGIRQDLGGLLEGRCGQERVSGQGCLGDTKDDLFSFRGAFAFRDQGFVPVFKIKDIDQAAGQEAGVAAVLDPDLFQHLPYDDFNVLIADINALKTVYPLDLTQQVILDCLDALDLKQIVGVDRTFCQLIAGLNGRVVQYLDTGSVRNRIVLGFTGLIIGDNDFTALLVILDADLTAELGDDGKSLGLSGPFWPRTAPRHGEDPV